MEDHELEALLHDLESDRVERTVSMDDGEKFRQAICAFANDLPDHRKPGVLFVGARNDGACAGLTITDRLLLALSDMRSDGNVLPLPAMTVQKRTIAGCELAVVVVEPSDAPPVRYKGSIWVRVGPRKAIASAQDERRLAEKRRAKDLPFDIRPVVTASLADIDTVLFEQEYLPSALSPEALDANERSLEQRLASLRFMAVDPPRPTVVGILVCGSDPRQFIPCDYIQFLRIDGTELADPIKDQKEIDGPLGEMLRVLDDTFQAHISTATDVTAQRVEVKHPDYPLVALQQLGRNAVMHRTYEATNAPVRITWFKDRIEIQNPGGPYGQVTVDNFGQPGITDYRNPHLAEAMKNMGYVQRFGVGIALARRALQANGNPPPEFTIAGEHVLATVRRAP